MKITNVFKCSQSSDTSHSTPQRSFIRSTSVIISFSRFDQVIRSSHCSNSLIQSLQGITAISTDIETSQRPKDIEDLIILSHYNAKDDQTRVNTSLESPENTRVRLPKLPISSSTAGVELPFETLCSRARRQPKRRSIYQDELIQPKKRIWRHK